MNFRRVWFCVGLEFRSLLTVGVDEVPSPESKQETPKRGPFCFETGTRFYPNSSHPSLPRVSY